MSDWKQLDLFALDGDTVQKIRKSRHGLTPEAYRAKRLADKRAEHQRHREARIAIQKAYAAKHRDKMRDISRRFYARNAASERERSRQRDPELRRIARHKWLERNPLYPAERERKRRAAILATQVGAVNYNDIVRKANGICQICHEPMNGERGHVDHIIPLARGGSHTQDNLQLAHARCNVRKGAKLPESVG